MKVTKVEAHYSRKVQIEQYEPINIGETITAELEDGDDPEDVYDQLYTEARDSVERKLTHRLAAKKMEDSRVEDNEE